MKRWLHHFLRGMASITLWPARRPIPRPRISTFRTDAEAIAGDWRAVGNDLGTAMKRLEADRE